MAAMGVLSWIKEVHGNYFNDDYYVKKADMCFEKRNFQQANELYTKVLDRQEVKNIDLFFKRGNTYIALNDFQNALVDYAKVLKERISCVYTHYNMAVAHFHNGKTEEAMDDINRFIGRYDGKNKNLQASAYFWRAHFLLDLSCGFFSDFDTEAVDTKKALKDLATSAKLSPAAEELFLTPEFHHLQKICSWTLSEIGSILWEMGMKKDASMFKVVSLGWMKKAIKLNTDDPKTYLFVALSEDNADIKLKYAKKAISLNGDYAEAHACLGEIYYKSNKLESALYHLEKAVRIKPSLDTYLSDLICFIRDKIKALKREREFPQNCRTEYYNFLLDQPRIKIGRREGLISDKGMNDMVNEIEIAVETMAKRHNISLLEAWEYLKKTPMNF